MTQFNKPSERVYVIESAERGLVAFEAFSRREAIELTKEEWFRAELASLRSNKEPIWDGKAPLIARAAEPNEVTEYKNAAASAHDEKDGIILAYLVPLDGAA